MNTHRLRLVALPVMAAAAALSPPAAAEESSWSWPLEPRPSVVRAYEAPTGPYAAGHRGVDQAAAPGAIVRAVDGGVVAFAGRVAGVEVVSVDHDGVRSTYQPVGADVVKGDRVARGAVLGRVLLAGGHCFPVACLHLGRRHGRAYADPLALLGRAAAVRLVTPYGPPPAPPPTPALGRGTPGGLVHPVDGPISSPFGMRVHPVSGELRLHDGTDFAVPCGTPVRSAAAGRVVGSGYDPAYGNRVVVEHGGGLSTTYNHLIRPGTAAGTSVEAGTVVGSVGSTGFSTGCHLHFMVVDEGHPVDPTSML
ncbi:peptidoglycan DD-metalloendopeptidase family protein [Mumia sp. zg.B53]|uniref:M23 family metallopeptidase n=1 Tax=Mumia sp. zg.B53 TaxID=2855449 RepID=UPI001C6E105F|nr:peptidoglycan DD-metalloendopeptidase family protein [Mumia sp. zg.B53]MBW9216433.1 peptidoglycan DD-metalloendopeptidase family protein [Mumia sp. zg.B53]